MSDLQTFFAESSRAVDERLDQLIPGVGIEPQRLHEAIRWSLFAGGKRFRPALVLATGKAFGAAEKSLLRTASAVEMIHTYSLIHDDLPAMDDDDLRRGRATCHKKFDEATAILAGDALQVLAFETIVEDEHLSDEIKVRLVRELAQAAAEMVVGQKMDLEAEGRTIDVERLKTIHQNKTGSMIRVSARVGAIIAGAGGEELRAVSNYGSLIGLLFQITDDLLDVTQTTEVLGKTAGKDVRAEKATYPAFYGIEETQRLAANTHAAAVRELNSLDRPVEILRLIADFILERKS